MAYTTINKHTDHFNTKLYTGTGAAQSLTGVGFQPDLTWIKPRSYADNNVLFDAVRGVNKRLISNANNAEGTVANMITAFDSDGFSIGDNDNVTRNSETLVAWNWKAGTGQGSSNTDGSINTTYTSVNTAAGFSICKWTGTGSNATIGHGLGVAPKVIIIKNLDTTNNWCVGHGSLGFTKHLALNENAAAGTSSVRFQDTAPTSTVFSVGTGGEVNDSGSNIIAYCFAEKSGYSKFGSYTGNGNANGTFVYTGFKPAFVLWKHTTSGYGWYMLDNKRDPDNVAEKYIYANSSNAEGTHSFFDLLSNGFKIRESGGGSNGSGSTYIYMAFGQSLVGSNNIPCTAR